MIQISLKEQLNNIQKKKIVAVFFFFKQWEYKNKTFEVSANVTLSNDGENYLRLLLGSDQEQEFHKQFNVFLYRRNWKNKV